MYVQVLCSRLAIYAQVDLAEIQAQDCSLPMRYVNWLIAEFSAVLTDLPEVIGMGIALNVLCGWPYYAGVLLSLGTTFVFLASQSYGIQTLEILVGAFVGIMGLALWVETDIVGDNAAKLKRGILIGFVDAQQSDLFAIMGVLGSLVMPHNLYLHSASCKNRGVRRTDEAMCHAARWASLEAVVPISITIFINMSVTVIAAQRIKGMPNADGVGLTDFCNYILSLPCGCMLWGLALLASGQSSAVTTTFAGQYIMDGFLNLRLDVGKRAILTRLVAICPCVVVSVALEPRALNSMVNIVNAAISLLLPFALTPLVKYTTSRTYMGKYATGQFESVFAWLLVCVVYIINAATINSYAGIADLIAAFRFGDFGQLRFCVAMVLFQVVYLAWILYTSLRPVRCKLAHVPGLLETDNAENEVEPVTQACARTDLIPPMPWLSDGSWPSAESLLEEKWSSNFTVPLLSNLAASTADDVSCLRPSNEMV